MKIYKQKVFIHHYESYMGPDYISHFDECRNNCESIMQSYESMEVKHNDVMSGKWQASGGQDITSDEFIDSYRFKPLI